MYRKNKKSFIVLEFLVVLIVLSTLLTASLSVYSIYLKNKIKDLQIFQTFYDLYYDIQYNFENIGFPENIQTYSILFKDSNNCYIKYYLDDKKNQIKKEITCSEDKTPEYIQRKILIKNVSDIKFEVLNNYVVSFKIYPLNTHISYPIIFLLHTPIYKN
jgi:hypothetical protein